MTIYKYMPLRPEFFQNKLVRASSNESLNDPFENRLSQQYLIDMILRLHLCRPVSKKDAVDFLKYNKGAVDNAVYCLFSPYGVSSFTETRDNLLMWAHYAEQHKGMVVGFDSNHEFFTSKYINEDNSHEGKLCRVLYRKERLCKVDDYLMDVFIHKSEEWSYEKEHRMVLALEKADKKLIRKDDALIKEYLYDEQRFFKDNGDYWDISDVVGFSTHAGLLSKSSVLCMYEIPEEAIKSVTFGCNSDRSKIEQSIKFLSRYSNVQIQKAKLDALDYRLRFEDF
ncbi:DUF2971 domain-containing protein [Vibrio tritonius]|uniref:DUF2971 domain-containing protein n=1 Tax=Vibrio tritonius TaxID=1435069 RepID=A0ABS7YLZ0_9VIBR|nr:DUF2971 domain-containing protein [Vibrio tritonius]MCA2015891.1 DUF2971 domain-containing protein [Vibrio tritonius]